MRVREKKNVLTAESEKIFLQMGLRVQTPLEISTQCYSKEEQRARMRKPQEKKSCNLAPVSNLKICNVKLNMEIVLLILGGSKKKKK